PLSKGSTTSSAQSPNAESRNHPSGSPPTGTRATETPGVVSGAPSTPEASKAAMSDDTMIIGASMLMRSSGVSRTSVHAAGADTVRIPVESTCGVRSVGVAPGGGVTTADPADTAAADPTSAVEPSAAASATLWRVDI